MSICAVEWNSIPVPVPADPAEVRRASSWLRRSLTSIYYLYTLSDPITREVRYVGCTEDPEDRARGHSYSATNPAVKAWVRELRDCGLAPTLTVVDSVIGKYRALARERNLIAIWSARVGGRLLNVRHAISEAKEATRKQ